LGGSSHKLKNIQIFPSVFQRYKVTYVVAGAGAPTDDSKAINIDYNQGSYRNGELPIQILATGSVNVDVYVKSVDRSSSSVIFKLG
jgi:hypothetical protein